MATVNALTSGELSAAAAATGLTAQLPKLAAALTWEPTSVTIAAALPAIIALVAASAGLLVDVSATAPALRASISGGSFTVAATAPKVTANISAVAAAGGVLSASAPRLRSDISALGGVSATIGVSTKPISAGIVAALGTTGVAQVSTAKMSASLNTIQGTSGAVAATFSALSVEAEAALRINGTAGVALPRVSAALQGYPAKTQVMTFVMNTLTTAATSFSAYPFNSFCEIDGKYYAASSDGLYQIEVPQTDVAYKMTTGYCSHKMPMQKHASDFYMNMHSLGDITLRVSVDEGAQYPYTLSPQGLAALRQRRSLLGKGLRGVYWQFEIAGTKDFDFDNYAVAFAPTARRT